MTTNIIVWVLYGIALGVTWGLIANVITGNKRQKLVQLWTHTGSRVFAHKEYELVTYNQHLWRVFTFRSARSLYGPLLQGVWNHTGNSVNTYDKFWWQCYEEIYLSIGPNYQKRTRHYMSRRYGVTLPYALKQADINPYAWLEEQPFESSMTAGVEEYDSIIAAQDMMEPQ